MGAFNTKYEKSEEANQKKFNINDFEVNKLKDDEEIFNNILQISKGLYTSYHLHFLNPHFCKQLSTVYKKKLFQLDITSLRNIHSQLNNKNSNSNSKQLEAVLSYSPSNQDTFIVNEFKTQLQEHLWNKEMELNPKIFSDKGIVLDDIPMTIVDPQNKLRYINIAHVNELLSFTNKKNNQTLKEKNIQENNHSNQNNHSKQIGGNNNNNSSSTSSSILSSSSSSSYLSQNNKGNSFSEENNFSIPNFKKNIKKNKSFENNFHLNGSNLNMNSLKKKIQNANKQFGLNQNNPLNQSNPLNLNKNNKINKQIPLHKQKKNNQPENNSQNNNSNIKFSINNNLQQFLNQIPSKNEEAKVNRQNKNHPENKINHENKKIQFQVRNYQSPSTFCKDEESCKMSKNDLCKAITEHFIVRGNIIASILSTLPRKTSSGFEGGYCYQRFLNLDKCQICLPHNYNELMSMDTKSRIQTMMLFINYMTEKECNENKGLYRKLSLGEKKSLILHGREGNEFNLLYTEYTNNVRVKYIQHLNILLEILNTLASMEGINNEELNALSLKTKETIDSMYHLCQFYYLYAIIALLNANITPIKREESNEKNKIKSNMKQFLASV